MTNNRTEIEIWEEWVDDKYIGWVGYYQPLDIHSQGASENEALEAVREAVEAYILAMRHRYRIKRTPERRYLTSVHGRRPLDRAY